MKDIRSGIATVNLQEIIDASVSVKAATINGQQQYSTPVAWARFFATLLPSQSPQVVFDPQCADGHLAEGFHFTSPFGFEIDKRFDDSPSSVKRLTTDCNHAWELLDELFPDLRFDCQVANPPFGLRWPSGDSTEVTWRQIVKRALPGGFGYFIANRLTIERLGIHTHEWAYLYQVFPPGFFPNTGVEVGVVHWFSACPTIGKPSLPDVQPVVTLAYPRGGATLESAVEATWFVLDWIRTPHVQDAVERATWNDIHNAWGVLAQVLKEEHAKRSPWNVWMAGDGTLHIYLSTRFQLTRKLTRQDIDRLSQVEGCHPLALTVEADTRLLLRELIAAGAYTIQPEADAAIRSALAEVASVAAPIMPVTDFERVAYTDELDSLVVRPEYACLLVDSMLAPGDDAAHPPAFTPGRRYPIRTGAYRFVETFTRKKPVFHSDSDDDAPSGRFQNPSGPGTMTTIDHECQLSGSDRYVEATDDVDMVHRFLEHPETCDCRHGVVLHHESALWTIFEKPAVETVAELNPDLVAVNRTRLLNLQPA